MFAEIFASLRGVIGGVANYAQNPVVLYAIILAIYIIYRRTSSA